MVVAVCGGLVVMAIYSHQGNQTKLSKLDTFCMISQLYKLELNSFRVKKKLKINTRIELKAAYQELSPW
jgi:hypothetical protein